MKENNNEKYEITLPAGDHTSKEGQAGRPFTTKRYQLQPRNSNIIISQYRQTCSRAI